MDKTKTKSVGERMAEKLRDENVKKGFVNWERISDIVNQEIAEENADTVRLEKALMFLRDTGCFFERDSRTLEWQVLDRKGKILGQNASSLLAIDAARGAEKKTLGSETPPAMGVVNQETGLAQCPFCGRYPKLIVDHGWHSVRCSGALCGDPPNCDIQPKTNGFTKAEFAIDAWNKRAPLTAKK